MRGSFLVTRFTKFNAKLAVRSSKFALALVGAALCLVEISAAPVQAVTFNFGASNGGFTATANGTSGFTYSGTSWSTPGQEGIQSNTLTSPVIPITATGSVTFNLNHRYNFEDGWDGGQLRFSVNGGAFNLVPSASFTANGYTNIINSISTSMAGQLAWTGTSAGYATPTFITSSGSLGSLNAGDNLQVQLIGAWDEAVVQPSPNWEITSLTVVPFEFSPTLGLGILGGAWLVRKKLKKKAAKV